MSVNPLTLKPSQNCLVSRKGRHKEFDFPSGIESFILKKTMKRNASIITVWPGALFHTHLTQLHLSSPKTTLAHSLCTLQAYGLRQRQVSACVCDNLFNTVSNTMHLCILCAKCSTLWSRRSLEEDDHWGLSELNWCQLEFTVDYWCASCSMTTRCVTERWKQEGKTDWWTGEEKEEMERGGMSNLVH